MLSGQADAQTDGVVVRVRLVNQGTDAVDVRLDGELLGQSARRELEDPMPRGAEAELRLQFPEPLQRPGLHAVTLRISSRSAGSAESEPRLFQLSYMAFPIAASPAPAFELEVKPARVGWSGELVAELHSLEGTPHRLSLRALTAPGLRAWPESVEIELPAGARRRVPLRLLRTGARDSRHGVLVEARVLDGPLERAGVVASEVAVEPQRGRVPGLRAPLVVLATSLLLSAFALEVARYRS